MKYKLDGQWYDISLPSYDATPVGTILPYAGSVIPDGYLWCDGSQYLKTDKNDLYGKIGDRYNLSTDTDNTKFRVPNIKGRVLVGLDTSQTEFDTLGETGGSKYLQEHNHGLGDIVSINSSDSSGLLREISHASYGYGYTDNAGTGDSGNLQPYIVVNYIIKASPSAVNTSEVVNEHSTSETNVYSANRVNTEIENAIDNIVDTYSTSEIKTNKIASNGKPVYRKVIDNITMSIGIGVQVQTGLTNIDTIEDLITKIRTSTQTFIGNQYYSSSIFFSANYTHTNPQDVVMYDLSGSALKGTLKITLEYTKTTD